MSHGEKVLVPRITILSIVIGMLLAGAGLGGSSVAASPLEPPAEASTPAAAEAPTTPEPQSAFAPDGIAYKTDNDVDSDIPPGTPADTRPLTPGAPADMRPLTPGDVVKHSFDVVVARLFESPEQIPSTAPVEQLPRSAVESLLSGAAQWWSDNTSLAFDFTSDFRYKTINTTCATYVEDAKAAMGQTYAVDSGRNLLVLEADRNCEDHIGYAVSGIAPTGDVFAGGITVQFISGWDGNTDELNREVGVLTHEFGHTIGLGHSNAIDCRGAQRPGDDEVGPAWDVRLWDECTHWEYFDGSNIMGNGPFPAAGLNSMQQLYLGVDWGGVAVVDQPTTQQVITISRFGVASAGTPHGVVVSAPDDSYIFSLEYRAGAGFEQFSQTGVYLALRSHYGVPVIYLPEPAGMPMPLIKDRLNPRVPLTPGSAFVSQDGTVRLRTLSVDATTARVEVTVTAQPGLPGAVSIKQDAGVLTANPTSKAGADVAFQWFRNGTPMTGATQATYTPSLPDANAVYRVEATFTAAGHAATTRTSLGIIPDDKRLSADGRHVTLALLDQNGRGVDCTGMPVVIDVATPNGRPVSRQAVTLTATAETGVCEAVDLPLTGDLRVTASLPDGVPVSPVLRNYYLANPANALVNSHADKAGATLAVGVVPPRLPAWDQPMNGYTSGTPTLQAGNGNEPLSVTVAVTDATGAPARGTHVTLSSALPGLVVTPVDAVTDEYGFAHATADWDRAVPPSADCRAGTINASVSGVATVTGAPADVRVCGAGATNLAAWFTGDVSVPANGTDGVELRVRAWDAGGAPIANQAGRLSGAPQYHPSVGTDKNVTVGRPTWDPADQSYVMNITSTGRNLAAILVSFEGVGTVQTVPIEFTNVPSTDNVTLALSGDTFSVSTDPCTGLTTVSPDSLMATVTVLDSAGKPVVGAPVAWSADAPLRIGSSGVTGPDGTAQVSVTLDASGSWTSPLAVRAVVNGSGATAGVQVQRIIGGRPPWSYWTVSKAPTGVDPVPADGTASWTVSVHTLDQCGVAVAGQTVSFTVDGTAVLSAPSAVSDADGWARVTVTDTEAEIVAVSAMAGRTPLNGSPVSVEFVSVPVVVVGSPVLGEANRTAISGTVVVGTGESEPVSVQVTYPSTRGPLTVEAAVRDRKWSVTTPDDAVSGELTLVARDARDNRSAAVKGQLVIPELRVEVGQAGVRRSETQTVTGYNFTPGERVHLVVHSDELDGGYAVADGTGKVVFEFKVPGDFAVGDHKVTLTGEKSGVVQTGFKVLADAPTPKPVAGTGGTVSPTPDPGWWLAAGGTPLLLVVLLMGAAAHQRKITTRWRQHQS